MARTLFVSQRERERERERREAYQNMHIGICICGKNGKTWSEPRIEASLGALTDSIYFSKRISFLFFFFHKIWIFYQAFVQRFNFYLTLNHLIILISPDNNFQECNFSALYANPRIVAGNPSLADSVYFFLSFKNRPAQRRSLVDSMLCQSSRPLADRVTDYSRSAHVMETFLCIWKLWRIRCCCCSRQLASLIYLNLRRPTSGTWRGDLGGPADA